MPVQLRKACADADPAPCHVRVQVYMDMLLQPIPLDDDLAHKLLQVR